MLNIVIYRSDNGVYDIFNNLLLVSSTPGYKNVIFGDLMLTLIEFHVQELVPCLISLTFYHLGLLIYEPTRVTPISMNVVDNVLTNISSKKIS